MDTTQYVLLRHDQALKRRLDISANNIANMSTPGFRAEQPRFREQIADAGARDVAAARQTRFVRDLGDSFLRSAGAFVATGRPLDIAVAGDGWLSVRAGGGTAYTRAGQLAIGDDGTLRTASGHAVNGAGGEPIRIAAEDQASAHIAPDGRVIGKNGEIGRIGLVTLPPGADLTPLGDALYAAEGAQPVAADAVRLNTGGYEAANVNALAETTALIDILRSYQASQRMADSLSDLRSRALDRLGRAG